VLDAQWFGVAQRRKRVFVVAHIGNEGRSKQVLFKRESVCRNTPPSRKAEKETAGTITVGTGIRCAGESQKFVSRINYCAEVTGTLAAADGPKGVSDQYSHEGKLIAISCMSSGQANAEITENICPTLSCLHEAPIVVDPFKCFYISDARKKGTIELRDQFKALTSRANGGDTEPCVLAFPANLSGALNCNKGQRGRIVTTAFEPGIAGRVGGESRFTHEFTGTLSSNMGSNQTAVAITFQPTQDPTNSGDTEPCVVCEPSMGVRRLTPRECERLQGFPDDYTMIQWRKKPAGNCPDGPRYKALGNSMAVPVMHWIGKRIAEVEAHG
jgi:DNA (cytosine-5)-methyltransferase 1